MTVANARTTHSGPYEGPFVLPLTVDTGSMDNVQLALYLAVMHHGFACFWEGEMTPASKQTVTVSADWFLDYLKTRADKA